MIGPGRPNCENSKLCVAFNAGAWEDWNDNEWRHFSNSFHLLSTIIWIVFKPNQNCLSKKSLDQSSMAGRQGNCQDHHCTQPEPTWSPSEAPAETYCSGPLYTNWFLEFTLLICFLLLCNSQASFSTVLQLTLLKGCFASTFYLKLVAVIEFIALLSSSTGAGCCTRS